MGKTVQEVLLSSAAMVALCEEHAADFLAMGWPEAATGAQVAAAGDGSRYAIERGVAVMPVRGLLTPNSVVLERYLGWATYRGISEACAELTADDAVSAAVLEFDTPGGYTLGVEEAAAAIKALAAVKPVYALAAPLAASAGYWLASQAREVVMTPGAAVGSIGVAVTTSAYLAPGASSGMQIFEFTSSHARAKWPDPSTDEGKAEIRRSLDESEARFHAAVAEGRGIALEGLAAQLSVTDDPADGGAVFDGAEAVARGLADGVETRADFYARVIGEHSPAPRRAGGARGAMARAAVARARAQL
ncbi:peptidase S49 [Rhodobacter sp. TJ_12]|uniref:S49 family peptidase n=1 Tax=Rhodobacter sp. TJ_12 TaxID=2029399 RepID=UPI001CBFFA2D|nr:S49 family peptidase [Rhodobacter sp. TJ_12]MBZ4023257.1 peptidase S49 [Rhodobacter sp. TJ_12]